MRILMFGATRNVRGPIPRIVELMTDGLRRAGCDVDVAHWGQRRPGESLPEKLVGRSADVLRIVLRSREREHDLVFVHSGRDLKALLREVPLSLAARRSGLPVVYMLHGTPDRWGSAWQERLWQMVFGLVISRAAGVFALSSVTKHEIERRYPSVPVWLTRYPYCPPLERGATRVFAKQSYTVVFVGRVIEEKGIHDLVAAWPSVTANTRARLVVCGDGNALPNARRQAADLHLTQSVECVGWQQSESVWSILQQSDAFVLPTLREGFPSALLEAMAAGLPIITTPVGGIPDWLTDGVHARFVPPRSPAQLATAICDVLSEPLLRERMSHANLEMVQEFASDRLVPEYLRMLGAGLRVSVAS